MEDFETKTLPNGDDPKKEMPPILEGGMMEDALRNLGAKLEGYDEDNITQESAGTQIERDNDGNVYDTKTGEIIEYGDENV